ncbi:hypothetical protein BZA77DRAFT_150919 [Pyronema omphalodes]|nr:hypothetical protein BZA77DRAFT_150919 [Pyronema omphalodes]
MIFHDPPIPINRKVHPQMSPPPTRTINASPRNTNSQSPIPRTTNNQQTIMTTPKIHTYHCTSCSLFLLSTTHNLHTLPVRASPSKDTSRILPFPAFLQNPGALSSHSEPSAESFSVLLGVASGGGASVASSGGSGNSGNLGNSASSSGAGRAGFATGTGGFATGIGTGTGKVVVAREDGFEKRILYRCGRCKVVVGYALEGKGWLYLLPEGFVETGRLMGEVERGERGE